MSSNSDLQFDQVLKDGFFSNTYSKFDSFGLIISSLAFNQTAFDIIRHMNEQVDLNPYDEVTIFASDLSLPVVLPLSGIMSLDHIKTYRNNIICFDIFGYQNAMHCEAPQSITFYISNMAEFIEINSSNLRKLNETVDMFICPSEGIRDMCLQFGLKNVSNQIVPQCNIIEILKVIKNEQN